jgi:hypothetical protein
MEGVMSDPKVYVCTICSETWQTIPEDAVQLTSSTKRGGRGHGHTYRFENNEIHHLKKVTARAVGEKQHD